MCVSKGIKLGSQFRQFAFVCAYRNNDGVECDNFVWFLSLAPPTFHCAANKYGKA